MFDELGSRFREAVELHEVGVAMMRKNLMRRHPNLDDQGITGLLRAWLQTGHPMRRSRDGPPTGDHRP